MCQILRVSESGYYRWLRNNGKPTKRQLLAVKMKEILDEHPDNDNYGVDRMRIGLLQIGHCFDNARMESFFATLKKEKLYKDGAYKLTREEVKTMIFRYVFVYYNRIRIYTANPFGLPPVKYREWQALAPAA